MSKDLRGHRRAKWTTMDVVLHAHGLSYTKHKNRGQVTAAG